MFSTPAGKIITWIDFIPVEQINVIIIICKSVQLAIRALINSVWFLLNGNNNSVAPPTTLYYTKLNCIDKTIQEDATIAIGSDQGDLSRWVKCTSGDEHQAEAKYTKSKKDAEKEGEGRSR